VSDRERRRLATAGGIPAIAPGRYARVNEALAERTHCDGHHALWDHLFEANPLTTPADFADLEARLAIYFHDLRGDPAENGSPQDAAREQCMAGWLAWAVARFPEQPVLLVCGGWHKR